MLRRARRPLAAFISLWFLLLTIEPEAIHSCPVHDKASAAHSGHGAHASAGGAHSNPAPSSGGQCSCLGDCAAAAGKALPAANAQHVESIVRRLAASEPEYVSRPHERLAFLLPFAIGPPESLAA